MKIKTTRPNPLPLSAMATLGILATSTLALHWLGLPSVVGLLGLPVVFYIAGREAEWVKRRHYELEQFRLTMGEKEYDARAEAEKAAARANRALEQLRKPRPGVSLEDDTTTTTA